MPKIESESNKILLMYVNNSLKEKPEILIDILKEFKQLISIRNVELRFYNKIIQNFITLVKYHTLDSATDLLQKSNFDNRDDEAAFNIAFEAIFGFRDGGCRNNCLEQPFIEEILGNEFFTNASNITCYQCHQAAIKNILDKITTGKTIAELPMYFHSLYSDVYGSQKKVLRGPIDNNILSPITQYYPENILHNKYNKSVWKDIFHNFLIKDIVTFSIVETFLYTGVDKIHRCKECGKFYISKTKHLSKYCSDKCRLAYHNRMRIQSGKHAEYKRNHKN